MEYDSNISKYALKLLGTNHFVYDRANSDDTEDFNASDIIPLMLVGSKMETTPFIDDRLHAHTSYDGSTADDKQDIIVVQAVTNNNFVYRTTGTTQPVIPYAEPQSGEYFYNLGLGLCPYDIYDACWKLYNNLLLNHPTHMTGRVAYSVGQILGMDMTRMKLCHGQKLMPVNASATRGPKPVLTETEFLLVQTFVDGIEDSAILPSSQTDLIWEVTDDIMEVLQTLWEEMGGGPTSGTSTCLTQTSAWSRTSWNTPVIRWCISAITSNQESPNIPAKRSHCLDRPTSPSTIRKSSSMARNTTRQCSRSNVSNASTTSL